MQPLKAAAAEAVRADVVVVGAGLAGLATAYTVASRSDRQVIVIDKALRVGAHSLSGALVDRRTWLEVFGKLPDCACPISRQRMAWLTQRAHVSVPALPPIRGSGCFLASYGRLCQWAAQRCEEQGVEVHTELSAQEPVVEDGRVTGLRLLGADTVRADCIVLAEGACGVVTRQVLENLGDGARSGRPHSYALGLKILVEAGDDSLSGQVYHSIGYPLGLRRFGGGFIYGIGRQLHVGLVVGLAGHDPGADPQDLFERYLRHPFVRKFMERRTLVGFGAKILDETGYWGMPAPSAPGMALVGEAAGLLNSMKLKGIGLALVSGQVLGRVLAERAPLEEYSRRLRATREFRAFYRARNVHSYFRRGGLPAGMAATGLAMLTGGLLPWRIRHDAPAEGAKGIDREGCARPLDVSRAAKPGHGNGRSHAFRSSLMYLTQVVNRGPTHIHLPYDDNGVALRVGRLCEQVCPAGVYASDGEADEVIISPEDCLHCGACRAVTSGQGLQWSPPVDGPRYNMM